MLRIADTGFAQMNTPSGGQTIAIKYLIRAMLIRGNSRVKNNV